MGKVSKILDAAQRRIRSLQTTVKSEREQHLLEVSVLEKERDELAERVMELGPNALDADDVRKVEELDELLKKEVEKPVKVAKAVLRAATRATRATKRF